jgi:hypothetical protein
MPTQTFRTSKSSSTAYVESKNRRPTLLAETPPSVQDFNQGKKLLTSLPIIVQDFPVEDRLIS